MSFVYIAVDLVQCLNLEFWVQDFETRGSCEGEEYLRLIDACFVQLEAQSLSNSCNTGKA